MQTRKLEMIFLNEESNRFTLSVDDPKSSIDKEEAISAMENIIQANVFESNNKDLKEVYSARIVTRLVEDLI